MHPFFLLFFLVYFQNSSAQGTTTQRTISGRYTRDVTDYEIVLPRKLKSNGAFHSFWLPHHYDSQLRSKRSLGDEDKVHYSLEFNGGRHHVELTPNTRLLTPGAIVETWRGPRNLSNVEIRHPTSHLCHYHGTIRGKPKSRVAMSACSGLAGHIQMDNNSFYVEPLLNEKAQHYGEHLHVIYKRSLNDGEVKPHKCGNKNDKWWEEWPKEMFSDKIKSIGKSKGIQPFLKRATEDVVPRYIEAGVILDKKFCDYHKDAKEDYTLTIMNIVNTFYRDASAGHIIELAISKLIFLDVAKQEVELEVVTDADQGLPIFCEWQKAFNHEDLTHPNHYDTAVLITRCYELCMGPHDICSEGECGLLGLAYMSKVCDTDKLNCCINEDSGLVLGTVITHEIGHLMGCGHDQPSTTSCTGMASDEPSSKGMHTVMHPICTSNTLEWSSCSREFMSVLFNTRLGECLLDEPSEKVYKFKDILPGAIYDANAQCRLTFGETHAKCNINTNFCMSLWCKNLLHEQPRCFSVGGPGDGTECGPNKWCFKGECIEMGVVPKSVDGGWGEWGPWSKCSRTCGGGVEMRERLCSNPQPVHLGRYCEGTRKEYGLCNTLSCNSTTKFRLEQCSVFNSQDMHGGKFTWKPHFPPKSDPNFCALYCMNENRLWANFAPMVTDGTRCHPGTKDTCIQGICVNVGCDWKINSGAVEDVCGVCNGDGTHCVSESVNYTAPGKLGRVLRAFTIPKGSSNIIVRELAPSKNYLHFAPPKGNPYLPNRPNNSPGEYKLGEDTAILSYPQLSHEELYVKGPIQEDLRVSYAFIEEKNPGVSATYVTEVKEQKVKPSYSWEIIRWGPCSVKCGIGSEVSIPDCVEKQAGKVSDTFCDQSAKPAPRCRTCEQAKCGTHWKVWKWGECSGCLLKPGERHRVVECVMESPTLGSDNDIIVDTSQCCGTPPKKKEVCYSTKPCVKKKKRVVANLLEREFRRFNRDTSGLEKYTHNFKRSETSTTENSSISPHDQLFIDKIPAENVTVRVANVSDCEEDPMKLSEDMYESEGDKLSNNIITNMETISGKDAVEMMNKVKKESETTETKNATRRK